MYNVKRKKANVNFYVLVLSINIFWGITHNLYYMLQGHVR